MNRVNAPVREHLPISQMQGRDKAAEVIVLPELVVAALSPLY
jgi:hypothetical protein